MYESKDYEDDYPGAGRERSDRKLQLSSGFRWRIDAATSVGLRLTLTDNDSNIDGREYRREKFIVTLSFSF